MTTKVTFADAPTVVVQRTARAGERTGVVVSRTFNWLFVEIAGCESPVAFDTRTGLRRGFKVDPKGWGIPPADLKRAEKWWAAKASARSR